MAVFLPNGAILELATTYAALIPTTAVTNTNPAKATAAAHGLLAGAIVESKSGWSRLNDRIMRIAAPNTNDFLFENFDTTDTSVFSAGGGVGSVRAITAWTQITQVTDLTTSGGDQQYATYQFLEDDGESQIPTVTSAQTINIPIGDDPSLPGYQALKAASDSRAIRALRMRLKGGSILLYNGYVSLNETPTMTKNQIMVCNASFALRGKPTRYAA